jgi:predicted nucleic-acid-binding Zn-ribbon protein
MINVTCFKCRRRFDLDPVVVGAELRKLKVKNPRYYQAVCPACHATNKVSVAEMQDELDAAAEEIEALVQERARAAEEAHQREAAAAEEKAGTDGAEK